MQAPERPFRFLNQEVPKQRDSSSCGWRVIANAWRFIESKYRMVSLTVSSAKLIKFKMFMCRVCDFNHIFFLVCSYMIIQNLGYGGSERSPFHLFLMGPSLQMTQTPHHHQGNLLRVLRVRGPIGRKEHQSTHLSSFHSDHQSHQRESHQREQTLQYHQRRISPPRLPNHQENQALLCIQCLLVLQNQPRGRHQRTLSIQNLLLLQKSKSL